MAPGSPEEFGILLDKHKWEPLVEGGYEDDIDTTLTPPGTQFSATRGMAGKTNRLIYAGFASPCEPLQRVNYHS
jgi:hypothetical protein